ncbi:N-acetyllactosaminide beta-1,6-N-acetylglucosaminyl-transferase-like [Glandiceps talaboti]
MSHLYSNNKKFIRVFGMLLVISVLVVILFSIAIGRFSSPRVGTLHNLVGTTDLQLWPSNVRTNASIYRLKKTEVTSTFRYRTTLTRSGNADICSKIIFGKDNINTTRVESVNTYLKSQIVDDTAFQKLASNCTQFIQERGYSKPVTEEELEFPLAFGIYMYKSVSQFEQLLRTIYRPQNTYCIHVDKKASTEIHQAVQAITKCFDNVFVPSRLATVTWGSIEVVRAELNCLSDLEKRNPNWKYYLNLSGQEFPLKTNLEIVQILKEFQGRNNVMSFIFLKSDVLSERHKFKYVISSGTVKQSGERKTESKPFDGPTFKGELHVALTREFVNFVLYSNIAFEWFAWLSDTLCPDEFFYQTLSRLPGVPGGYEFVKEDTMIDEVVRAKIWHGPCNGKIVREICVYGWKDLPSLVGRPHLFANKFHADFDSVTLECLEELINNRTYNPIKPNLQFYKNFSTSYLTRHNTDSDEVP